MAGSRTMQVRGPTSGGRGWPFGSPPTGRGEQGVVIEELPFGGAPRTGLRGRPAARVHGPAGSRRARPAVRRRVLDLMTAPSSDGGAGLAVDGLRAAWA